MKREARAAGEYLGHRLGQVSPRSRGIREIGSELAGAQGGGPIDTFEPARAHRALLAGSARMPAYPRISPHIFAAAPFSAEQEGAANKPLWRGGCSEAGLLAMQKVEGSNPFSRFQLQSRMRRLWGGVFRFGSTLRSTGCRPRAIWRSQMDLSSELDLRQINPQEVAVFYKEGFPAFTIAAVSAHDAIGSTVPTQLAVAGSNVITLTVGHRGISPAGGSFVYPVIGGAGWEGGYRTISVELAEPEPENEEELEEIDGDGEGAVLMSRSISAPIAISNDSVPQFLLDPINIKTRERNFRFERCTWMPVSGDRKVGPPSKFREFIKEKEWKCTGRWLYEEGNLDTWMKPRETIMMRGHFRYKRNSRVWLEDGPSCFQWGPDQAHQIRCYADKTESSEHINMFGQWRFDPGKYVGQGNIAPVCFEINPTISPSPPKQEDGVQYLHEFYHWSWGPRAWQSECSWHDLLYKIQ